MPKVNKPNSNSPRRRADGSRIPTFFGQHHAEISAILKGQRPYKDTRALLAWDAQVRGFAHCLSNDNPKFDTDRFFRECGGLPTYDEEAA